MIHGITSAAEVTIAERAPSLLPEAVSLKTRYERHCYLLLLRANLAIPDVIV